jgi:hypothetical protein
MSYVLNPITNRMIRVNGKIHKKLMLEEKKLTRVLKSLSPSRRVKKSGLRKIIKSVHRGEGRGSRTRGWTAMAPQRGRERSALLAKCGAKCFLLPNQKKFPVCSALRVGENCKVNCKGILSAKIRAGQHKYNDVANLAEQLEKMHC